ncbi:hypothetical protein LUZ60_003285 [Juncus effusus]|nr:hypothetical protein LUZ60_003285 [Juncus effusus]
MAGTLALKALNLSSSFRRTSVRAAAAATATPSISFPVCPERNKSLYEVLRVKETASRDEIRTAYRSLAKREHPDVKSSGGFEEFVEIRRAYETLSDPQARARYDLSIGRVVGFDRVGWDGIGRFGRFWWNSEDCQFGSLYVLGFFLIVDKILILVQLESF